MSLLYQGMINRKLNMDQYFYFVVGDAYIVFVCFLFSAEEDPSIEDDPVVDLSLVVPAYNEELRLAEMMEPTLAFLKTWTAKLKLTYEVQSTNWLRVPIVS